MEDKKAFKGFHAMYRPYAHYVLYNDPEGTPVFSFPIYSYGYPLYEDALGNMDSGWLHPNEEPSIPVVCPDMPESEGLICYISVPGV